MSGSVCSLDQPASQPANELSQKYSPRQAAIPSSWHDLSVLELIALGIVAVAVLLSTGATGVKLLALYDPLLPLTSAIEQLGGTVAVKHEAGHDVQLHIDLHARPVTDLSFLHDARFFSVAELDLTDTPINDAGLAELARPLMVRRLKLGGTQITDAGLGELARVQGLSELSLHGTRVTKAGLAMIANCPHLSTVDLSATVVSQQDVDQLPISTVTFRID